MIEIEARQRDARYKFRAEKLGGHVHLTLFSQYIGQDTWANCGNLCLAEDEIEAFFKNLKLESVKIVEK